MNYVLAPFARTKVPACESWTLKEKAYVQVEQDRTGTYLTSRMPYPVTIELDVYEKSN